MTIRRNFNRQPTIPLPALPRQSNSTNSYRVYTNPFAFSVEHSSSEDISLSSSEPIDHILNMIRLARENGLRVGLYRIFVNLRHSANPDSLLDATSASSSHPADSTGVVATTQPFYFVVNIDPRFEGSTYLKVKEVIEEHYNDIMNSTDSTYFNNSEYRRMQLRFVPENINIGHLSSDVVLPAKIRKFCYTPSNNTNNCCMQLCINKFNEENNTNFYLNSHSQSLSLKDLMESNLPVRVFTYSEGEDGPEVDLLWRQTKYTWEQPSNFKFIDLCIWDYSIDYKRTGLGSDKFNTLSTTHCALIKSDKLKSFIYNNQSRNFNKHRKNNVFCDVCLRYHTPNTSRETCLNQYNNYLQVEKKINECIDMSKKKPKSRSLPVYIITYDCETDVTNDEHKLVMVCATLYNNITKQVEDQFDCISSESADAHLDKLVEWSKYIKTKLHPYPELKDCPVGNFDLADFSGKCVLCDNFIEKEKERVIHHCHYTGKIHGYAHEGCNISEGTAYNSVGVFAHNHNYDLQFFIRNLMSKYSEKLQVLASDLNNFKSITIPATETSVRLVFLDFMNFVVDKLSNIIKMLKKESHDTVYTWIKNNYEQHEQLCELVKGKLDFPYQMLTMDNINADHGFDFTPNDFVENSTGKPKKVDLKIVKLISEIGFMKGDENKNNLYNLTKLYCMLDNVYLAVAVGEFMDIFLHDYKCNMAAFTTLSSLSYFLGFRNALPGLIKLPTEEYDEFIREHLYGGLSMTFNTHFYKENDNHLVYYDVNSLYSHAMTLPLPTRISNDWNSDTHMIDLSQILNNVGLLAGDDGETYDYMILGDFELVMQGPNDYLPMPYRRSINPEDLSDIQKIALSKNPKNNVRLLVDYHTRKDYCLSGSYLKEIMKQGAIKSYKIKRVVELICKPVLKDYINANIDARIKCVAKGDEVGSAVYKLLNNSCYGSNIIGLGALNKKISIIQSKNLNRWSLCKKVNSFIMHGDKTMISKQADKINVENNILIGWMILNHSKLIMYRFWCEFKKFIKESYNTNISMYYTDTDSMFINIQMKDNLKDMYEKLHEHPCGKLFDFCSLKGGFTNPLQQDANGEWFSPPHKTHGLMSSELAINDDIISAHFLSPKVYCYKTSKGKTVTKGKGVISGLVSEVFCEENMKELMYNFDMSKEVSFSAFKKISNTVTNVKLTKKVRNSNTKLFISREKAHLLGYDPERKERDVAIYE